MNSDWQKRLTDAIDRKKTNMKRLSLAAGLEETFVRDALVRGRIPSVDNAMKLCRELGMSYAAIFGDGQPDTASPSPAPTTELNIQAMPKDLPVMGNASCGDDGLFELNGQILDHVRRPPRLMGVKDAYALWISGESMAPWREHGGLVVVHPHQPVRVNDYVVVQLKSDGTDGNRPAYIKRLLRRTGSSLVLLQHNPRKEITLALSKVSAVHRILDWDEAMGI